MFLILSIIYFIWSWNFPLEILDFFLIELVHGYIRCSTLGGKGEGHWGSHGLNHGGVVLRPTLLPVLLHPGFGNSRLCIHKI